EGDLEYRPGINFGYDEFGPTCLGFWGRTNESFCGAGFARGTAATLGGFGCLSLTQPILLRLVGQYPRVPDLGRWVILLFRFRRFRRRLGRLRLRGHRFRS